MLSFIAHPMHMQATLIKLSGLFVCFGDYLRQESETEDKMRGRLQKGAGGT